MFILFLPCTRHCCECRVSPVRLRSAALSVECTLGAGSTLLMREQKASLC